MGLAAIRSPTWVMTILPKGRIRGSKTLARPRARPHQVLLDHLAGIEDLFRIDLLLERLEPKHPVLAQHLFGLAGEVEAGGIGPTAVLFGDLDDRQHQAENEVVGELALVAGDEAQDDDLGLPVSSFRMMTPSLTMGWLILCSISSITSPRLASGMTISAGTSDGPSRLTTISLKRCSHSCSAISWLRISPGSREGSRAAGPRLSPRSAARKARTAI